MHEKFYFIADKINFNNNKNSIEIDDLVICRPDPKIIEYLREYSIKNQVFNQYDPNIYEFDLKAKSDDPTHFNWHKLESSEWKYTIIKHNLPYNDRVLPLAFSLSRLNLRFHFESWVCDISGLDEKPEILPGMYDPIKSFVFFTDRSKFETPIKEITESDIKEIKDLIYSLKDFFKHESKFDSIDKSLKDFMHLQRISNISPFKVIGFFSILELLLSTYKPNESSINEQLKNKINLINNLSKKPILVMDYFNGPDTLNLPIILGKLYRYRNSIAHGNKVDFEKDLSILADNKNKILDFLNVITKMVLKQALLTPELIEDLKKC
ncbi:HEPN domain-containing protein [Psychroflexus aestuariivivens]|uniref:HEPN domain-containing protein n=1 Tax=Psychroflexus aestuariivivens TaxID=1795040 RepID=UPI000FDA0B47|nr:HEPN domain-containing protein [Psychroflexus aestuariivivens]